MKKTLILCFMAILVLLLSFRSVEAADSADVKRLSDALGSLQVLPPALLGPEILTGKDFKAAKDGVVELPFSKTGRIESRIKIDQPVDLDVSRFRTFYIDVTYSNPDPVGYMSFYFQSEKGWYSMSAKGVRLTDGKSYRYTCNSGNASHEGKPTGFHKITIVRLAFYPKENIDTSVRINAIYGDRTSTAVLSPSKNPEAPGIVRSFQRLMSNAGIAFAPVAEENITPEQLKNFTTVIIPAAGRLQPATVDMLCDYADQGGFIIAFYGLPAKLMTKLGFQSKGYMRCNADTTIVKKVVFEKDIVDMYAPRLPSEMGQESYNMHWGMPLENITDEFLAKSANQPRVAAWWYDDKDQKTQYPAMLWSGRGIYFAHILLADDTSNKYRFLTALCSQNDAKLNARIFHRKWEQIAAIGYTEPDEVAATTTVRLSDSLDKLAKTKYTLDDVLTIQTALEKGIQTGTLAAADIIKAFEIGNALDAIHAEMSLEYAQKVITPCKVEGRLLWEHSGLGPYPGDWDRTMRELSEAGFNAIVPNMCWGGAASYKSDVLPVDSNCEKYGDQIAQCVAAGKKYGMQVHVWKVNFNCGSRSPKEFVDRMRSEGRLQYNYAGENDNPWLCPSHPANQDLEVASMVEIAEKYDVDGLHFDYIRFPDPNHCFCPGCKDRFSKYYFEKTGKQVANWPEDTNKVEEVRELFLQWRREQITSIVKRVSDAVRPKKPNIKISCAARSAYPGTLIGDAQDWVDWCNKGYLDFVCPMNYTDSYERFIEMTTRQEKYLQHKVPLYAGIGIVTPSPMSPDMLAGQIMLTRKYKTGGFCLFALTPRSMAELVPAMKETPLRQKAAMPK